MRYRRFSRFSAFIPKSSSPFLEHLAAVSSGSDQLTRSAIEFCANYRKSAPGARLPRPNLFATEFFKSRSGFFPLETFGPRGKNRSRDIKNSVAKRFGSSSPFSCVWSLLLPLWVADLSCRVGGWAVDDDGEILVILWIN